MAGSMVYNLKRKRAPRSVIKINLVLKEIKSLKILNGIIGSSDLRVDPSHITCEKEFLRSLSCEGNHQKQKANAHVLE